MVLGFMIGFVLGLGLAMAKIGHLRVSWTGLGRSAILGLGSSSISVWIAERRGKAKSIEEIHRPQTLFPPS